MSVSIASNILQYESNLSKQKGYTINFESNNFEKILY